MEEKHCWNCEYFNGEQGDNEQFCDERETYVHEDGYCYRHINRKEVKD